MDSSTTAAAAAAASFVAMSADDFVGEDSSSWLSFSGWLIYKILHLVSSLLYWAIRIVTITIPTALFNLLSSSWTVTMNATTL
jgi:lysophospholipid hydrolase